MDWLFSTFIGLDKAHTKLDDFINLVSSAFSQWAFISGQRRSNRLIMEKKTKTTITIDFSLNVWLIILTGKTSTWKKKQKNWKISVILYQPELIKSSVFWKQQAFQKLLWNLISENRLRAKYADSAGNKFRTNFWKMNGKPLYTSLDIVIVYFEMIQRKRCVCCASTQTTARSRTSYVFIFIEKKNERGRERERGERKTTTRKLN